MSYNTRQGDRRGAEVDLYDFTYDGDVRDNYLSGGLGQLTDREEGQSNFRLDHGSTGRKGFEWVGWKNETADTPPVDLLFEFNSVRNFSSVRFHTNNMFTKDVRVFRMAKLYFSIGGKYFLNQPVVYNFMRDTLMEYSRPVIIPAQHRIGKFVKVELYFDARWILLSEIKFESGWNHKIHLYYSSEIRIILKYVFFKVVYFPEAKFNYPRSVVLFCRVIYRRCSAIGCIIL